MTELKLETSETGNGAKLNAGKKPAIGKVILLVGVSALLIAGAIFTSISNSGELQGTGHSHQGANAPSKSDGKTEVVSYDDELWTCPMCGAQLVTQYSRCSSCGF